MCGGKKSKPAPAPVPVAPLPVKPGYQTDDRGVVRDAAPATPLTTFGSELGSGQ